MVRMPASVDAEARAPLSLTGFLAVATPLSAAVGLSSPPQDASAPASMTMLRKRFPRRLLGFIAAQSDTEADGRRLASAVQIHAQLALAQRLDSASGPLARGPDAAPQLRAAGRGSLVPHGREPLAEARPLLRGCQQP